MWYIEYLLLNKDLIKEKGDIESDEFNDLLILEREVQRFKESNLFSQSEVSVLDYLLEDGEEPPIEDKIFVKSMQKICSKLSISLGGIFSNAGYISYMQERYKLTDEQARILEQYMLSRFRNKIMSKPYRLEE